MKRLATFLALFSLVAIAAVALPPFIGVDRIPATSSLCPSDALVTWAPSGTYGVWATASTNTETGLPATLASEADFCTIFSLEISVTNATSMTIASLPDLGYIDVSDCALTSVSISNCVALVELYFNFNQLSSAQVNQILYQLSTNAIDDGVVVLNNQTPAAPPTTGPPDGVAAKATLEGRGWTVSVDP